MSDPKETTPPPFPLEEGMEKPRTTTGLGLAAAMLLAASMEDREPRARWLPPESKKRNPKRGAQAAQRKARKIQRRAGK